MKNSKAVFLIMLGFLLCSFSNEQPVNPVSKLLFSNGQDTLLVHKVSDFELTGDGDREEWQATGWNELTKLDPAGEPYLSRFKILYSSTGIYVLFNGVDNKITTKYDQDMGDLYNGDVFEVFFHPDHRSPSYFEYEINQLNKELILLLTKSNGKSYSWAPWHYESNKRVKKMVKVNGGAGKPGARINSWSAEVFFPNELFTLLPNVPPKSGTVWNANFYRLDYDLGEMIKWSWSPTIEKSFHELEKFGHIRFE